MTDLEVNGNGNGGDFWLTPDMIPTVREVAAQIRSRTKDTGGNEVGTFNEHTRPTDEQAQEAIDNQIALLGGRVAAVGEGCTDLCRVALALGAAAEIELSYFSEQIRTDRSTYVALLQRVQDAYDGLIACVTGELPGGDGAKGGYTITTPSGVVADYYGGGLSDFEVTPVVPSRKRYGRLPL